MAQSCSSPASPDGAAAAADVAQVAWSLTQTATLASWFSQQCGADMNNLAAELRGLQRRHTITKLKTASSPQRLIDIAGPQVFDDLLDRVDLPHGSLVGHAVGGKLNIVPRQSPGQDRSGERSGPSTEATIGQQIDTVSLHRALKSKKVAALQVKDAWCLLPQLRAALDGLDAALQLHTRLDLVLLPPGGRINLGQLASRGLYVTAFGEPTIEWTDANPAFTLHHPGGHDGCDAHTAASPAPPVHLRRGDHLPRRRGSTHS